MAESNENVQVTEEFITPVELSKLAGCRPQAIYNLIRQGYITADRREVVKTMLVISAEDAQAYLDGRAQRAAKKAAKEQAELAGETDES